MSMFEGSDITADNLNKIGIVLEEAESIRTNIAKLDEGTFDLLELVSSIHRSL